MTVSPYFKTDKGTAYLGDTREYLSCVEPNSVDLVMTSPPFALIKKKEYGNESSDQYLDWFRPFAEGVHKALKDTGSFVIDLGGAYNKGSPTRSLYQFKLLIMLVEEYGFHLAQEHYWLNPHKLPSPIHWVNTKRVRVKDSVNTVWWLSKTEHPKANNRNVLQPYSEVHKHYMTRKRKIKGEDRPSGHVMSGVFYEDNGGSIPNNLLIIPNSEYKGQYQNYCKDNGLKIHPARFPNALPEYFIRLLTDPGDRVLDIFGGSCVTGMVAENLGRDWVCVEQMQEYLDGAKGRFFPSLMELNPPREEPYKLYAPCIVANQQESDEVRDGEEADTSPDEQGASMSSLF